MIIFIRLEQLLYGYQSAYGKDVVYRVNAASVKAIVCTSEGEFLM